MCIRDSHKPGLASAPDFVENGHFKCAIAQMASDNLAGGWGFVNYSDIWLPLAVLYGMTAVMLILLLILLKRRDPV